MLDFVAYAHAQQRTADRSRQALPDAPVRPDPPAARFGWQRLRVRARLGLLLRALSDRVRPPEAVQPASTRRDGIRQGAPQ